MSILFLSVDFYFYCVHISNIIYHLFSQVGDGSISYSCCLQQAMLGVSSSLVPLAPQRGLRLWMNYVGPTTKPKFIALRAELLKLQNWKETNVFSS